MGESDLGEPRRKRIVLINRDFQLKYAWAASIVGLSSTALTSLLILYPLYKFEILRIVNFVPLPIMGVMLVAAIVNVVIVGVMTIYLTHKVVGPLYGLVRSFRVIEDGDWESELKTRDGDELNYVVRNFNGMMASIVSKIKADGEKIKEIELLIRDSDAPKDQILKELDALKESISGRLRSKSSDDSQVAS